MILARLGSLSSKTAKAGIDLVEKGDAGTGRAIPADSQATSPFNVGSPDLENAALTH